jgi:signal transduction histidine kinase
VDLAELAREQAALFGPLAESKSLAWTFETEPGESWRLRSDRHLLRVVLGTLIGASVKYTSQGEVRMTLGRSPSGSPFFEVRDTGPGFTVRSLQDWRDQGAGGWGLSEQISKKLVGHLSAELFLESQPGEGTRARVSFCKA